MANAAQIATIKDYLDDSDLNTEYFCFQEDHDEPSDDSDTLMLSINGQYDFVLALPGLEVSSDDGRITEWVKRINAFSSGNKNVSAVLKEATKISAEMDLTNMQEDSEEDDAAVFVPVTSAPVKSQDWAQEAEFDNLMASYETRGLVNSSNKQASSRIFADLKGLWKSGRKFGFWAEPKKDNLLVWNVTFFDFEKDSGLFKDVQEYKKRTGRDYIEFLLEFPPSYPFAPPFIRAVRPRFQFHTGHITIGGSVCMQLLTQSGWTAANSIESVLISIRTEITSGGGRLDLANTMDYTDAEAKAAFHRVARDHGWEK